MEVIIILIINFIPQYLKILQATIIPPFRGNVRQRRINNRVIKSHWYTSAFLSNCRAIGRSSGQNGNFATKPGHISKSTAD
jgi:hypothetical protein